MTKKFKLPYISEMLNREFLMEMSKADLEKLGRANGIEIDKRLKKQTLANKVYAVL